MTSGDTEILLRWVAREWEKSLPRFDGMFAFAAWDRQQILPADRLPRPRHAGAAADEIHVDRSDNDNRFTSHDGFGFNRGQGGWAREENGDG
jgi:hypothetical protein